MQGHREKAAPAGAGERPRGEAALPAVGARTSSLPQCEKTNLCGQSPLACRASGNLICASGSTCMIRTAFPIPYWLLWEGGKGDTAHQEAEAHFTAASLAAGPVHLLPQQLNQNLGPKYFSRFPTYNHNIKILSSNETQAVSEAAWGFPVTSTALNRPGRLTRRETYCAPVPGFLISPTQ